MDARREEVTSMGKKRIHNEEPGQGNLCIKHLGG
jgi:hypothetical protein